MPAKIDLTGRVFTRLTVLHQARTPAWSNRPWWTCQCSCGNTIDVLGNSLTSGNTKSCRCLKREVDHARFLTHGLSHTPEHGIWSSMIDRCTNPNSQDYKDYGARGIYPCERWLHDFMAFYTDKCPRPSPKHELDRIDNDGPYSPENTRWVLRREQTNNKRNNHRITWNGETHTLAEWCRLLRLPVKAIAQRFNKLQWSPDRAFTEPVHPRGMYHPPRPR